MSNKTFNISMNQVDCPRPSLQLALASDDHYRELISPSPDSPHDWTSSQREVANMQACPLSKDSPDENLNPSRSPQGNLLCSVSTNLNQTFIATPVEGSLHFWNANLTPECNHETGLEIKQAFHKYTDNGRNGNTMSPDSTRGEGLAGFCEASCRGSTGNGCCSLSSEEMIVRSNSFGLEDRSALVVSSLEDSPMCVAAGCQVLAADSPLSEGDSSPGKVSEAQTGHPSLGLTFTQAELPTVENEVATEAPVDLPSEKECLFMTFVCEPSPVDLGKGAQFPSKSEVLCPTSVTPEQGKAVLPAPSTAEGTNNIYTSTPIQDVDNKTPSLPSFSGSPGSGNAAHPIEQQRLSAASKHISDQLPPSEGKIRKLQLKKFPKTDFSNIKSKVVTRNSPQMKTGPVSEYKAPKSNMDNKHVEGRRGGTIRISPAKARGTPLASTTTKTIKDAQKGQVASHLDLKIMSPSGHSALEQDKNGPELPCQSPLQDKYASAGQCGNARTETEHLVPCQAADAATHHAGNQTCLSSREKSPDGSGQTDPRPTPKKHVSNKIEARSGSALGRIKPSFFKTRLRCSSETSSSLSRPPKEKKINVRLSNSFCVPTPTNRTDLTASQDKQATRAEDKKVQEKLKRGAKKISLIAASSKLAKLKWDESKTKLWDRPSPRPTRESPHLKAPAARPRTVTLPPRERQTTLGKDECRTSKPVTAPPSQQKPSSNQKAKVGWQPSFGATSIKPKLNGSLPPPTPTRTSIMGLPRTPAYRRKTLQDAKLSEAVSGGAGQKQNPLKTVVPKARNLTPSKHTGQSSTPTCKPAVPVSKAAYSSTASPWKRTSSGRFTGLPFCGHVDKSKAKASSRQQTPQQPATLPNQANGPPDVVPGSSSSGQKRAQSIQQVKGLLAASNCRFEAFAVALQHWMAKHDDAAKQCRDLSQELVNLRGELVCSVQSSELLEKEKEELQAALEEALQNVQEQHQKDLVQLEQRLQAFYQAEWDKVHQSYQEEADKCKGLMQQQMVELKDKHEAMKQEQEKAHSEQLEGLKQQYEISLEELSKSYKHQLQDLDKDMRETEAALSRQIEELNVQNQALLEKLNSEENRRKSAEKSQRDSHTLYLEQELDSLKVVLDIKNQQLHQQEKKLMELEKLKDKNVKLDESLTKVQQENEHLIARMDRHAALSRQLSTEQAVLQESLQKESKVNKRLSMENEELLWKLHNGDLSSPRRTSPTASASASPSHAFSLQSPRSSGVFSSPPLSPR
ncbi:microtubule-associated tumor suppressor 1 homolog A isoform X2 [Takifugu rubripes]|uniref:Microtubule associated tumor suppressor 1b n=2 Tax=Takifugu rubripes TaxID=31033 RepID=A0A3B5KDZ7_TAKRU|nr:microtubule-associated tumor suppressor 1 isoform X2 [Takifugu rubripes]XP_029702865.1 microtubule-associated tumor suppressor 1 isoform X2 [Takifugu rubripes]